MSSEKRDNNVGDLIDLHVGSPVLPRISPVVAVDDNASTDNLIDTELPILEQKLQTASCSRTNDSRRTSVDIEDILITIEDDDDDDDTNASNFKPIQRSNSEEILLDLCYSEEHTNLCKSLSYDNLEALIVLKNLDDVLNATLIESNKILNDDDDVVDGDVSLNNVPDEHPSTETVEECLLDLDNYLKTLDSSGCEDNSIESNSSICNDDQLSTSASSSLGDNPTTTIDESNSEETDQSLRNKLRQMELNYTKFLASGFVNRAYVDTENLNENGHELRRPLSACDMTNDILNRNHPGRATVAAIRRERPIMYKSTNTNNSRWCTLKRNSGPTPPGGGGDSDEDIDWSWVQDVARDVILERHAHAAGDRCTGTVVVEPLQQRMKPTSSGSSTEVVDEPKEETRCSSTWLRNSMRRLRHFRLPSDAPTSNQTENANNMGPINSTLDSSRMDTLTLPSVTSIRPVSAPSRLPPSVSVSQTTTTTTHSRSRSRDSRHSGVSHEPGGRARSSSASSRSRRGRSISSSESSLASSVDTTPSCTPAATPTHTTQEQPTTSPIPRR